MPHLTSVTLLDSASFEQTEATPPAHERLAAETKRIREVAERAVPAVEEWERTNSYRASSHKGSKG